MSQETSPAHRLSTREIIFITLTVLLSIAVVLSVLFALSRCKSRQLVPKKIVFQKRTTRLVDDVLVYDSEKAINNDACYTASDTHISFASIHDLRRSQTSTAAVPQDKEKAAALSHSRTTSSVLRSASRRNSADMTTTLSIQAGLHCVSRRTRQDSTSTSASAPASPSFATLESNFTDSLAFQSASGSSKTSIMTIMADSMYSADEDEEEDEEEPEVYEVQRVQTQSMEIQKGVLVAYRASTIPHPLPPIIENLELDMDMESDAGTRSSQALFPDAHLLSSVSSSKYLGTVPSAVSLASSVSIDLADFPLPPVATAI